MNPADRAEVDLERPNAARMYDYYLGGAHNFDADRVAADAVLAVAPQVAVAARANRAFLRRVVHHALARGVSQFLDLGSGIPTVGNVHDIAHQGHPTARVVYVDVEPVAATHAQALVAADPHVGVVEADLRHPQAILADPQTRRLLDLTQPLAILLVSVLHFVPGDLTEMLTTLRDVMAPGSLLALSHASTLITTAQTTAVTDLYTRTPTPLCLRSPQQIRAMFTGLTLVSPNPASPQPATLVPITHWRPEPPPAVALADDIADSPFLAGFLAGVGHLNAPTPSVAPGRAAPARNDRSFAPATAGSPAPTGRR